MRRAVTLLAATLASVVGLAACGGNSSGLIPPSNAQAIGSAVTTLTAALAAHDCTTTRSALQNISSTIGALPSSVDRRLLNNLEKGENTLALEAPAQCKAPASTGSSGVHHKKPSTTGPTGATNATGTSAGGTPGPTGQTGTTGTTTSTGATGSTTPTGPTDTTSVGGGVGPGDGSGGSTSTTGTTGSSGDSTGGGAASG